ncbi:MAG: sugar MFS transporter [Chitinophagaceae bacterium]|nr:sugar MFS transporter [Chitinophagaceae bacterium]
MESTNYTSGISKSQLRISILIVGGLFFVMGFLSWMNAILIPYFKIACELSEFSAYLVAFAFYISYVVMSVPAGYVLKKHGFKKGLMYGFLILSAGAFIFVPAALTRTYEIFLLGLFTFGAGLAIIQTAANPYITILGPIERAAQRFSIMGIFNKGAGILAPIVFASIILRSTDDELFRQIPLMNVTDKETALDELIQRVILPYACLGVLLLGSAIFIRYSSLPEINTEQESPELSETNSSKSNVFHFPHLILGVVGIFVHVGSQVIAVDTVINYAISMDVPLLEAKVFPSYTLASQVCGYILGIALIPRLIRQVNALRFCTVLGTILTLLIVYTQGQVLVLGHSTDISIWFVVLLGFANSLIWAGMWPLALDGLGKFTKIGSSVLIMALCGNAIMPLVYGYFAEIHGRREAYWVLFPCYIYLVFYAFYGHRIRRWSFSSPMKNMVNQST